MEFDFPCSILAWGDSRDMLYRLSDKVSETTEITPFSVGRICASSYFATKTKHLNLHSGYESWFAGVEAMFLSNCFGNSKTLVDLDLSLDQIKKHLAQVLGGLEALHQQGFVHGDVQPATILDNHGVAKLIHFHNTIPVDQPELFSNSSPYYRLNQSNLVDREISAFLLTLIMCVGKLEAKSGEKLVWKKGIHAAPLLRIDSQPDYCSKYSKHKLIRKIPLTHPTILAAQELLRFGWTREKLWALLDCTPPDIEPCLEDIDAKDWHNPRKYWQRSDEIGNLAKSIMFHLKPCELKCQYEQFVYSTAYAQLDESDKRRVRHLIRRDLGRNQGLIMKILRNEAPISRCTTRLVWDEVERYLGFKRPFFGVVQKASRA